MPKRKEPELKPADESNSTERPRSGMGSMRAGRS